jgi:hypothetical protein
LDADAPRVPATSVMAFPPVKSSFSLEIPRGWQKNQLHSTQRLHVDGAR